ncbi:MAG: hypothetical protein ACUVRD_00910 [Bacteroidia bacterium]
MALKSARTYLDEKGNLVFTTRFGEMRLAELYCSDRDKKPAQARFV